MTRLAPRPGWRSRLAASLVFLLACAAPYYADAWFEVSDKSAVWLAYFIGLLAGFFAVGFYVGRWWVISLLVLAPLVIWPLGVAPDDSDGWTYAWLFLWGPWLFGAPLLLLGLIIRTGHRWWKGQLASQKQSGQAWLKALDGR